MQVIKADGTKQEFSQEKLTRSIRRAGISDLLFTQVYKHVNEKLYDGISTKEIHQHISEFLGKSDTPFLRTKYRLKQAIMDLGPTGYPFEDYVAKLLRLQGFTTLTRQIISGRCITHEVDVVAQKDAQKIMVEAKFHNGVGIKTDVHVALYTKARFDDIAEKNGYTHALLITNTKATTDAISYAHCVGMDIITWSYPEEKSLRDLVEKYQLYPITALSSLSQTAKAQLLENGTVLCSDLCHNPDVLQNLGLPEKTYQQVLRESQFVCNL